MTRGRGSNTVRPGRRWQALLLAGVATLPACPAVAQGADSLRRSNAALRAEVEQLRAALARASAAVPGEQASPAAPPPSPPLAPEAPDDRGDRGGDRGLDVAITVTAVRLKDAPRSTSVVTGEELEKFQVNNFRDIVNRIGNVRTSWNNPNTASIFVRGIGWAAGAGVLEPSVGVAVDDVSHGISAISALSNYLDVETVEVVRGPTGSDGLRATDAGRVVIRTRAPSFTPEAAAAVTYGQRNALVATAVLGGPIVDDLLAYRISINREQGDGPYKNRNDTHYTWRNTDRTNVRAQLLVTPTSGIEARLIADYTPTGREICENCFAFNLMTPPSYDWIDPATRKPALVDYAEDAAGKLDRRWFRQKSDYTLGDYLAKAINTVGEYPNTYATKGASADIKLTLAPETVVRSITAWRDYDFSQGAGSHTQFEWLRAPRGTQTSFHQWSEELRLDARPLDHLRYRGGLFAYRGTFPNYSQTERYGSDAGAWYANAKDYALLDPVNPALPDAADAAGRVLLLNAADGLITRREERYLNRTLAAYSHLSWDATDRLTLDAGARLSRETRHSHARSFIQSEGFAAELDPARVNDVVLGGFDSDAAGNLTDANDATQRALADRVAQKYFGAASYGALTMPQRAQLGAAKAVRAGRIGALYQRAEAAPYRGTLATADLALSYKLTAQHTLIASYRHGEKPGVAQIVGATSAGGTSAPVAAERVDAYELGVRTIALAHRLQASATAFHENIGDYIQPGFVYDPVQTALDRDGKPAYRAALSNVPQVRSQGVELDVALFAIPYTTLRFAGSYTDARYRSFPRAPNPGELGGDNPAGPYHDASGTALPGAPRWSGNLFGDFSYPVANGRVLHVDVNHNFQSGYFADTTLSRYTKTHPWGITDVSAGLGLGAGRFDVALLVRNLFDVDNSLRPSWNQYKPGIPRWVGLQLRGSL
ncbi:TonB-dependent receptor [Sphingomonas sp. DT-51]|uniref:TonB-dependent receptor n=1 Tax=Sphingomonas sp. DT-51 TaxID=3396165 RepID=UPI003F19D0C7